MKNLFILILIACPIIYGCNSNSCEKKTIQNGSPNLNEEQIINDIVPSPIELD